jgi:hypothetical protein
MKLFQEAVREDVNRNYVRASELYEMSLERADIADAYINLAVLYFQFTDFGINAASGLRTEFIQKAFNSYDKVIERGIAKFPDNGEMRFWKKYFRFSSLGDELEEEEVLSILRSSNSSLVPYFFLYLLAPEKYKVERDALCNQCHQLLTSKNMWILSLIE